MVPFETALVSFYRPSIVTFPLSLRVPEILPLLFSSMPLFPYPTSSLPKISPCSPWSRWIARPPGIPIREFPTFPGNPPRQKFPAGIPGNYWVLGENFWEFIKCPIFVISCCELWKLAGMKTYAWKLFTNLNHKNHLILELSSYSRLLLQQDRSSNRYSNTRLQASIGD